MCLGFPSEFSVTPQQSGLIEKVDDIKTIEELSNLTEKTLGKRKKRDGDEEEGMWNKKSILWEL
jgi:hypothetical protein